jgi:hypothetical protein
MSMTSTQIYQQQTFGPPGDPNLALPTAPRPIRFQRNYRRVGHHEPTEMMAGFSDTLEIVDVATLICPICGVRRDTTVEAACEHDWLCNGSTVLVL